MKLVATENMKKLAKKEIKSLDGIPKVYFKVTNTACTKFKQNKENNAIFIESE